VMSKSGFVGIIVADLMQPRLASIAHGAQRGIRQQGTTLLLASLDDGQEDIAHILKHFAAYRTEVLLLALGENAARAVLAPPAHSALERCLAACGLWFSSGIPTSSWQPDFRRRPRDSGMRTSGASPPMRACGRVRALGAAGSGWRPPPTLNCLPRSSAGRLPLHPG
jgi:hypothetical protein